MYSTNMRQLSKLSKISVKNIAMHFTPPPILYPLFIYRYTRTRSITQYTITFFLTVGAGTTTCLHKNEIRAFIVYFLATRGLCVIKIRVSIYLLRYFESKKSFNIMRQKMSFIPFLIKILPKIGTPMRKCSHLQHI